LLQKVRTLSSRNPHTAADSEVVAENGHPHTSERKHPSFRSRKAKRDKLADADNDGIADELQTAYVEIYFPPEQDQEVVEHFENIRISYGPTTLTDAFAKTDPAASRMLQRIATDAPLGGSAGWRNNAQLMGDLRGESAKAAAKKRASRMDSFASAASEGTQALLKSVPEGDSSTADEGPLVGAPGVRPKTCSDLKSFTVVELKLQDCVVLPLSTCVKENEAGIQRRNLVTARMNAQVRQKWERMDERERRTGTVGRALMNVLSDTRKKKTGPTKKTGNRFIDDDLGGDDIKAQQWKDQLAAHKAKAMQNKAARDGAAVGEQRGENRRPALMFDV
jgi:hypothetical protein